jgi:glycosyltransferase involved in cell wall biosynthesis
LFPACPHVHLESGFGPEEADGQLRRRALFRRLALARTGLVVVPSQTLVDIATRIWRLDPAKVRHIPNGVDCARFAATPDPGALPGFEKAPGELVVGTVAPLRREKNLGRLLHAFAAAARDMPTRLLILGDGAERPRLEALAAELGLADRVVLAGHVEAVDRAIGLIDVFAMSSDTEQMPNSLLQAMAAGLPVAATDVGDVKRMVATENGPYIVPRDRNEALGDAFRALLCDADARSRLGWANRERARREYGQERMFRAYESVFGHPQERAGHAAP